MKKPANGGPCSHARGLRARSGRGQPVARIERAAHAQRQRRDIDQFVGGHLLGGLGVDGDALDRGRFLSLVRPFCLAGGCRTGYRKE
jgi:hypothetical protein